MARSPLSTGKRGRPRPVPWPNIHLGQVIKRYVKRRVTGVTRQLVQGEQKVVDRLLQLSQNGGVLNTAFIERLNGTFRSRLSLFVRRTHHLARRLDRVEAAIYLVGCVYNFCTYHSSLRLPLYVARGGSEKVHWVQRTPAIAAGITDHRRTILVLLQFKVPPQRSEAAAVRPRLTVDLPMIQPLVARSLRLERGPDKSLFLQRLQRRMRVGRRREIERA